jgi:predicted transcriptional regulator YdeE
VEPTIVDRDGFHLLGLERNLSGEEQRVEVFQSIWSGFEARMEEIRAHSLGGAFYGVSFSGDEPGGVNYLAAMAVPPNESPPEGMVLREIPPARYAVFECPVYAIGESYRFIFGEWLPNSGYGLDEATPVFEQYPPEDDALSHVLIHVPITEPT